MLTTTTKSLLTLAAFGLSTLLVGGYLGGEMARRRHIKEDIKAIQLEHAKTLARIDSVVQQAAQNEIATLAQIDSVYSILADLNKQEAKSRGQIQQTTAAIKQKADNAKQIQTEIIQTASKGGIILRKKTD